MRKNCADDVEGAGNRLKQGGAQTARCPTGNGVKAPRPAQGLKVFPRRRRRLFRPLSGQLRRLSKLSYAQRIGVIVPPDLSSNPRKHPPPSTICGCSTPVHPQSAILNHPPPAVVPSPTRMLNRLRPSPACDIAASEPSRVVGTGSALSFANTKNGIPTRSARLNSKRSSAVSLWKATSHAQRRIGPQRPGLPLGSRPALASRIRDSRSTQSNIRCLPRREPPNLLATSTRTES